MHSISTSVVGKKRCGKACLRCSAVKGKRSSLRCFTDGNGISFSWLTSVESFTVMARWTLSRCSSLDNCSIILAKLG